MVPIKINAAAAAAVGCIVSADTLCIWFMDRLSKYCWVVVTLFNSFQKYSILTCKFKCYSRTHNKSNNMKRLTMKCFCLEWRGVVWVVWGGVCVSPGHALNCLLISDMFVMFSIRKRLFYTACQSYDFLINKNYDMTWSHKFPIRKIVT